MKTVLITGANGFIGSRICAEFLAKKYRVYGLVRRTSDLSYLKGLDVELLYSDLSDLSYPAGEIKKLDFIIHVAGLAIDWGPYGLFYRANVEGTLNVLDLGQALKVKKTVILSSLSVMGFGRRGMTEETAPEPSRVNYVLSKLEMENQVLERIKKSKETVTILRPGDVYGEYDRTTTLQLFKALEEGSMGFINKGRAVLAPLYVGNLVQAVMKCLITKKSNGQIFNITDGKEISWKEYISEACKHLNAPVPKLSMDFFPAYLGASLMEFFFYLRKSRTPPVLTRYRILHAGKDYSFNIEKAKKVLKYRPDTNIKKNLKKTAQWYLKSRKIIPKILITGVAGFWGQHLLRHFSSLPENRFKILGTWHTKQPPHFYHPDITYKNMNLERKTDIQKIMKDFQPNVIIHTAAMSSPLSCEKNPKLAEKLNIKPLNELIKQANLWSSRLIFFSTDLLYRGDEWYFPEHHIVTAPNIYEETKIRGEEMVRQNCYDHLILRCALSYGLPISGIRNPLQSIIRELKGGNPVELFSDQFRTPISALEGSRIIEKLIHDRVRNLTLNFGGPDRVSRFQFGLNISSIFGFDRRLFIPVNYEMAKGRHLTSPNAAMDTTRLRTIYGHMQSLRSGIREVKKEMKKIEKLHEGQEKI